MPNSEKCTSLCVIIVKVLNYFKYWYFKSKADRPKIDQCFIIDKELLAQNDQRKPEIRLHYAILIAVTVVNRCNEA